MGAAKPRRNALTGAAVRKSNVPIALPGRTGNMSPSNATGAGIQAGRPAASGNIQAGKLVTSGRTQVGKLAASGRIQAARQATSGRVRAARQAANGSKLTPATGSRNNAGRALHHRPKNVSNAPHLRRSVRNVLHRQRSDRHRQRSDQHRNSASNAPHRLPRARSVQRRHRSAASLALRIVVPEAAAAGAANGARNLPPGRAFQARPGGSLSTSAPTRCTQCIQPQITPG